MSGLITVILVFVSILTLFAHNYLNGLQILKHGMKMQKITVGQGVKATFLQCYHSLSTKHSQ